MTGNGTRLDEAMETAGCLYLYLYFAIIFTCNLS